jgi:hypothetical protein
MGGEFDLNVESAGPTPRQGPPGFHRSENKALPCIAATAETRKIVSVSMAVLNSIFAKQVAFFGQNAVQRLRLDLPQKAERPGLVSAEITGGKATRVSHWEPRAHSTS